MTNINLNQLCVLVTRPKPEGEKLCQLIREHGGEAIYFPTIEIEPVIFSLDGQTALTKYDWLIFISPKAVDYLPIADIPKNIRVAAVGAGTAKALINRGISVTCYPEEEQGTLGLLKLPAFKALDGKEIVIVRGENGRELLAETLIKRGAKVTHWVVYRRRLPKVEIKLIPHLLRNHKIDIIVVTSMEGIRNLLLLLDKANEASLRQVPLVVVSDRMKAGALALKFERVMVAKNASHESILDVLNKEKL